MCLRIELDKINPIERDKFFLFFNRELLSLTQDSRLKTQDSRLKTQDSRLKTQDSRLKTQDSRLKTQDSRAH